MTLLASVPLCLGQEEPKAELVDKFGNITCEDFSARTDALFQFYLWDDPTSTAYVVFYPAKSFPRKTPWFERMIKRKAYLSKFDNTRLKIVRGANRDSFEAEFWIVPPGADKPVFDGEEQLETLPDLTKPFIFDSVAEEGVCPTFIPERYADLIKENANVRGHIVVFDSSKINRRETANYWLATFTKELKVPRNRLKIFFAKDNNFAYEEFWIVPIKKK
jgi:hypothetical protein